LKLEHENWPRGKPSEGLGSNLKGGGRLSGRVVEQTAKKVLVDVGDGIVDVSMDRVEQIVKGPSLSSPRDDST
jgi:hypothetical protein